MPPNCSIQIIFRAKGECIFGCVRKETPCPTVIHNLALPSFQESGWLRRFLSKYTLIRLSSACPSYTTWTHLEVSWRGLSCVHLFHLLRYPFLGDQAMLEYSATLINWKKKKSDLRTLGRERTFPHLSQAYRETRLTACPGQGGGGLYTSVFSTFFN